MPSAALLRLILLISGLVALPAPAAASAATGAQIRTGSPDPGVAAGDPAPELAVDAWWIEPRPLPAGTQPIRVVHFWRPGPSAERGLPGLSALEDEYADRGVRVLGLVAPCAGLDRDEARLWVSERRARLRHALAWDTDGRGAERWLGSRDGGADAQGALAFVVDRDGRVVYRGHPRWLRGPLEGLLAGDWDVARDNAALARAAEEFDAIYRTSGERPDRTVVLCSAFRARHPRVAEVVDGPEFDALLALDRGREAATVGRRLLARARARQDAFALNDLAWALVDPMRRLTDRDLDLALEAASEAARLTEERDAYVLDTLARVHARRGELERAVALQERAVALLDEPLLRQALEEYLRRLRAGR